MSANEKQVGGQHYQLKIQPWDYIAGNGLGYLEGNIVKYVSRWRGKGGVQDLEKARHYLDKLIETARADGTAESAPAAELPKNTATVFDYIQASAPRPEQIRVLAESNQLPLLPIVVGGVYRTRKGSVVEIVSSDASLIPYRADNGCWYTDEGIPGGLERCSAITLIARIS